VDAITLRAEACAPPTLAAFSLTSLAPSVKGNRNQLQGPSRSTHLTKEGKSVKAPSGRLARTFALSCLPQQAAAAKMRVRLWRAASTSTRESPR
jgi:hypothetical protein